MTFDTSETVLEDDPEKKNIQDISSFMSIMYEIKDELDELKESIHSKDTETIQAVVKAVSSSVPVETPETALMKVLLPEIIKNPDALNNLIRISEMSKKKQE